MILPNGKEVTIDFTNPRTVGTFKSQPGQNKWVLDKVLEDSPVSLNPAVYPVIQFDVEASSLTINVAAGITRGRYSIEAKAILNDGIHDYREDTWSHVFSVGCHLVTSWNPTNNGPYRGLAGKDFTFDLPGTTTVPENTLQELTYSFASPGDVPAFVTIDGSKLKVA